MAGVGDGRWAMCCSRGAIGSLGQIWFVYDVHVSKCQATMRSATKDDRACANSPKNKPLRIQTPLQIPPHTPPKTSPAQNHHHQHAPQSPPPRTTSITSRPRSGRRGFRAPHPRAGPLLPVLCDRAGCDDVVLDPLQGEE